MSGRPGQAPQRYIAPIQRPNYPQIPQSMQSQQQRNTRQNLGPQSNPNMHNKHYYVSGGGGGGGGGGRGGLVELFF